MLALLEKGAQGGAVLDLRSNFDTDSGREPHFNLVTFNYKILDIQHGAVYVARTPQADRSALKTQLWISLLLRAAGKNVSLFLNPDDLAPSDGNDLLEKRIHKAREDLLQTPKGRKILLQDVDEDIRRFMGQRVPYYNRKDIGFGYTFQDYGSILDSALEQYMNQVYKNASSLQRVVYSIGASKHDLEEWTPDQKSKLNSNYARFCNSKAVLLYGESYYLPVGHKMLNEMNKPGNLKLPPGWEVVLDESNDIVLQNPAKNLKFEMGYKAEDGHYVPYCSTFVNLVFGDMVYNFGATHVVALFNNEEAKLVNEYAALAKQVFSLGPNVHYVVGGKTDTATPLNIYDNILY
ncbi:Uncharacterised protein [uncultured archaeon]|nr:Uncharacterised protein [uncultured archaeon]